MIYTVTFNPSLDYIVSVEVFKLGLTNRTNSELMLPGGKGLNVSMVLSNLGIENTAFGFAAGFTGDEITRRIEERGIRADSMLTMESQELMSSLHPLMGRRSMDAGQQFAQRR